jgi:hypothetical protein
MDNSLSFKGVHFSFNGLWMRIYPIIIWIENGRINPLNEPLSSFSEVGSRCHHEWWDLRFRMKTASQIRWVISFLNESSNLTDKLSESSTRLISVHRRNESSLLRAHPKGHQLPFPIELWDSREDEWLTIGTISKWVVRTLSTFTCDIVRQSSFSEEIWKLVDS